MESRSRGEKGHQEEEERLLSLSCSRAQLCASLSINSWHIVKTEVFKQGWPKKLTCLALQRGEFVVPGCASRNRQVEIQPCHLGDRVWVRGLRWAFSSRKITGHM